MHNPAVESEFERALETILMRVFREERNQIQIAKERTDPLSIAVAYSGGLDSTVLLHLAQRFSRKKNISLFAFHVHHGLSRQADKWCDHCEAICAVSGVRFESRRVQVDLHSKNGIEADARSKRYAALGEMCRKNRVSLLLTAHHQDDQVETVLFHLMRGTGMAGLSGMDSVTRVPGTEKDDIVFLGRPLLSLSRKHLSQWAKENGLSHVEDDSNSDTKYTRNAIRHRLVPVISDIFPGFQRRLTRMAKHAATARDLLNELGEGDLQTCRISGNRLDLAHMANMSASRMENLLRCWFMENGIQIPSTAWFLQAKRQMLDARPDAQINLQINGYVIRRYRAVLSIEKSESEQVLPSGSFFLQWKGESFISLDMWHGVLEFEESESGMDVDWLKKNVLRIDAYRGNAALKLPDRPTKKLKILCQEAGIPLWERHFLPLVSVGNDLIYVGRLGQSAKFVRKGRKCIRLNWKTLPVMSFK